MPSSATGSRLASTPSSPHSWMVGPLIWAAVGGSPDTTRDLSTVIAASPPPPATAKSFQVSPLASSSRLSSATEAASPPEVHQCRTSTSPAGARDGALRTAQGINAARAARRVVIRVFSFGGVVVIVRPAVTGPSPQCRHGVPGCRRDIRGFTARRLPATSADPVFTSYARQGADPLVPAPLKEQRRPFGGRRCHREGESDGASSAVLKRRCQATFTLLRRARPTNPSSAEPNSQAAAGIGTTCAEAVFTR